MNILLPGLIWGAIYTHLSACGYGIPGVFGLPELPALRYEMGIPFPHRDFIISTDIPTHGRVIAPVSVFNNPHQSLSRMKLLY
jgi:hypothetical protein